LLQFTQLKLRGLKNSVYFRFYDSIEILGLLQDRRSP
jgi:hypothetical protein